MAEADPALAEGRPPLNEDGEGQDKPDGGKRKEFGDRPLPPSEAGLVAVESLCFCRSLRLS